MEAEALQAECFPNVLTKVERDGGKMVLGWQLWEWPEVLVEGEFHAVWESPEGNLVDITPKETHIEKILFLPDPEATYDGRAKDNFRMPLNDNRITLDLIKANKKYFKLLNSGALANYYGPVVATPDMVRILNKLRLIQHMLKNKLDENIVCLCGKGGKKYKNCCGREFG